MKIAEGRDKALIDGIAMLVEEQPNLSLLDLRRRAEQSYTTLIFAGPVKQVFQCLEAVGEAAFKEIKFQNLDPVAQVSAALSGIIFFPIRGIAPEQCKKLIREFAGRFYDKFSRPVIFSGQLASMEVTDGISEIQNMDYSALTKEILEGRLKLDIGSDSFQPEKGVVLFDMRNYAVSVMFHLDTSNIEVAQEIADEIGMTGRAMYDKKGEVVRDSGGEVARGKGRFPSVETLLLDGDKNNFTRIICKLKNSSDPTLVKLFDTVREVAHPYMVDVLGSEIVGHIHLQALQTSITHLPHSQTIQQLPLNRQLDHLYEYLGLNVFGEFNPQWQVIDFRFIPFRASG